MTCWAIRPSIPTAPSRASRSKSCWWSRSTKPIASLASRRCGIPRWWRMRCWKPGTPAAEAAAARGLEWLKPLQVLDVKGDWAEEKPDVRPGGWAFQYRNDYYPDLDDTAVVVMAMDRAAEAQSTLQGRHRARRRMGRRPAKPRWRLGRLRCRQLLLLPEQYSLRRSWRAAGSADRRRLGPLCRHDGAAGRRQDDPRLKAGVDYLITTQRGGRILVGPLGRQLHLWHLVGAGGTEWRGAWRRITPP